MTTSLRAVLILGLLSAGCAAKDSPSPAPVAPTPPAAPSGIESTSFAPALGVDLAASTKTPTGLYYRDLQVGSGPAVAAGQRASMRYTGWLADGTQFDSNSPDGAPYVFIIGAREVIDGWDQGVTGMRVGGRRQLIIPPALGYGAAANGPIPANAVLVFTVELLGVQ